jgi:TPR repeat protein
MSLTMPKIMSTDKIKASIDTLSKNLKSLRNRLETEGGSLELFSDRQYLTVDVMNIAWNTRGTKFEARGRKLNKEGSQIYRDILSNIKPKSLIEDYNSSNSSIKKYAAEVLVLKYDNASGVSEAWLKQNKENYFEWAEASILGNKRDGSDGRAFDKYKIGLRYIEEGNYKRGIELLEEALEAGEYSAATELGQLYSEGEIKEDGPKAKQYFEIAIKKKWRDTQAMVDLSEMYLSGVLIEEDLRQAFLLANKAYKQIPNHLHAQEILADCYNYGWGTRSNKPKAYKFYFDMGLDYSTRNTIRIAEAYLEGIGVDKDISQGLKLLRKAQKDGDNEAAYILGHIYSDGDNVKQNNKKAFEYFNIAATTETPYILSYNQLGICNLFGSGTPKNLEKARYWFEKAYNQDQYDFVRDEAQVWLENHFGLEIK